MKFLKELYKNFRVETSIGILMLSALGILVYFSISISSRIGTGGETYPLYAYLQDAVGIDRGTAIRSAGIRIGYVEKVELESGRAKVTMQIQEEVKIDRNAFLMIRSLGLLGDKYLEIRQTTSGKGLLFEDDVINLVSEEANIEKIMENLANIISDLNLVSESMRNSLGTPSATRRLDSIFANLESLTASLGRSFAVLDERIDSISSGLDETFQNTAFLTEDLEELVAKNRSNLDQMFWDLSNISSALNKDLPVISTNLAAMLTDNRQNIRQALENLQQASAKLDSALASLDETSKKLNSDEGTIGRLINDPNMAQSLEESLDGLQRFLGEASRVKLDVGAKFEAYPNDGGVKGYVGLIYTPRPDHWFSVDLVTPKHGVTSKRTEVEEKTTRENGTTTNQNTKTTKYTTTDSFRLSLQISQRYFDTVLRGGMIENTFGLGWDQFLGVEDQFKLTMEGWNFNRENNQPHYKASMMWRFLGRLYFTLGYDDLVNEDIAERQGFLGVGLDFNEDSLKILSSSLPITGLGGN